MALAFRPAVRSQVGLFVGYAGETGSGKTMSGMRFLTGAVGRENRFAVIDAENKRASHYAPAPGQKPDFISTFNFDVIDFEAPFSSERYAEMVTLAVKEGYKGIMLDSASHEHDSEGGYLDRQSRDLEQRVERYMKKYPNSKEWEVFEKLTPSSWIEPKRARNHMMQVFLACSTTIPIVFCFRAQEKVFGTKDGKLVAHNPPIWSPICGKNMPFEMTAFFLMHASAPGVPVPLKLQAQHRPFFPLDKPIDERSGQMIAEWSRGGAAPLAPVPLTPMATHVDRRPEPDDGLGNEIPAKPPSDGPDIHSMIMTATNFDTLNEAIDLIRSVKDEHLRAELDVASRRRAKELRAKA